MNEVRLAIVDGNLNRVRELVGVDSVIASNVLHYAINLTDNDEIIDMILGVSGIDLTLQDDNGDTGFHLAVRGMRYGIAKRIMSMDFRVMAIPNNLGNLPLHTACEDSKMVLLFFDGNREMTRGMIEVRNREGYTPLELACRYKSNMGMILFLRNGAKMTQNRIYKERIRVFLNIVKIMRVRNVPMARIRRVSKKLF